MAVIGMFWFEKGLEVIASLIEPGDVVSDVFREVMASKLDEIKDGLDVLRKKEFEAAKLQMKSALSLCQVGADATDEFNKARANAEMAIGAVKHINDKIEASKMASMCAAYESGTDLLVSESLAKIYLDNLQSMKEIRSTFDVIYGSGIMNRIKGTFGNKARGCVVANFYSYTVSLNKYFRDKGVTVKWPFTQDGNKYIIHPLTVIPTKDRITKGDACDCEHKDEEYIPEYKFEVYGDVETDEDGNEDGEEDDTAEGKEQEETGDDEEEQADDEEEQADEEEEQAGEEEEHADDEEEQADEEEEQAGEEEEQAGEEDEQADEEEEQADEEEKSGDEDESDEPAPEDEDNEEHDEEIEDPAPPLLRVFSHEDDDLLVEIQTEANVNPISSGGYLLSFKLTDDLVEEIELRKESTWELESTINVESLHMCAESQEYISAAVRGALLTAAISDCLSVWDIKTQVCIWNISFKFQVTNITWDCDKHLVCTREDEEAFTVQMYAAE